MLPHRIATLFSLLATVTLVACGGGGNDEAALNAPPGPPAPVFANPERVTIVGYDDDAMEPALSPDGRYLFFNNSNTADNTDLRYAERVDDRTFQYRGPVAGANSDKLDGVPSIDRFGNMYWVSTRSYDDTMATIYRGAFANGAVTNVALVPGISTTTRGELDFDVAISADGNTMYFAEGIFAFLSLPLSGEIKMANRTANGFARADNGDDILRTINAGGIAYAPVVSQSGLEIFFNRVERTTPVIYTATRASTNVPFGGAQKVTAIDGFAEGPALSADEKSLYYHRQDAGRYVIYRVTRP